MNQKPEKELLFSLNFKKPDKSPVYRDAKSSCNPHTYGMKTSSKDLALSFVRIAAAGNMLIHGISRTVTGGVPGFDEYLSSLGFPPYSAFLITAFELIAAVLIILNRWTSILSIVLCIELIAGIILVHGPEGWFVVGHGRNGSEYSVLLLICFISAIVAYWPKREGQK